MIKRISLLSVMLAGSALAQQNMDISEKDVTSGAAQARLSALARDAAASGKRVVVTAPQHLHAQIAAGLAAGAKADIVLKDGFYENVLVRVVDAAEPPVAKPEVPKPTPRTVAPAPERAATPAPTRPQASQAPAPAAVRAPSPATPVPAPAPVPAAPTTPAVEKPLDLAVPPASPAASAPAAAAPATPAATPAAETASEVTAPAVKSSILVATEPGDLSPVRTSLEKLYNDGKRIGETIVPGRLINGDLIYTGNGAAVVVRRARPSLLRFWLDGSLDLDQSAIDAEGSNKYRVIGASVR